MNNNLHRLNDIFIAIQDTLIKHSDYSLEEFNNEFDSFKHYKGKELSDNDYYNILVDVVFYSGFRASPVTKYMPSIKRYFSNYEIVAEYGEEDFENIMKDNKMIKNARKIRACMNNAKKFEALIKRFGDFKKYIHSFAPDESDDNLLRFKDDLENFEGLGRITTFHFMTDIGLNVIKPDRVLMRIFKRLGLINDLDDLLGAIEVGRKFSIATGLPIRYIDIIFVLYGQLNVPRLKCICAEKQPSCEICGAIELCNYSVQSNETYEILDKASIHTEDLLVESQQFFPIKESSYVDVLDENLYCYDSAVFSLMPAMQNRASDILIRKVKYFVDSAPAAQKAKDYVRNKTEFIPRLDLIPEEIKQALQNGTAEIIPCKNATDAFYLQIRTTIKGLTLNGKEYGINKKIKDIPLGTKNVPADVVGAMQCLSMQNQLNQIANGLREISEVCEFSFGRIIQGQRDDRLAKLFSSRSCFIQALAMSDEYLQRQMLIHSIRDANSTRAELAFQIKSDIALLGGDKSPNSKDMEKMVCDINTAIVAMNNAVQISLYSYQVLGERNAQLAVIKEHETFIKQVLLKEIKFKSNRHPAWMVICSSGNSGLVPQNFRMLPTNLIDSCVSYINNVNEDSLKYLEGETDG